MDSITDYVLTDILYWVPLDKKTNWLVCKRWQAIFISLPVLTFSISLPLSVLLKNKNNIRDYTDGMIYIIMNYNLSQYCIEAIAEDKFIRKLSRYQYLPEEFIGHHADLIDWDYISGHQPLSEAFIDRHADRVNWKEIYTKQKLGEEFIKQHVNSYIFWIYILEHQKLTEAFIEHHADKFTRNEWIILATYQQLSEAFIERYADKMDWRYYIIWQRHDERRWIR